MRGQWVRGGAQSCRMRIARLTNTEGPYTVECYGDGIDTTVPAAEFVDYTRWIGGAWYLAEGPYFWRMFLQDFVRVPGLVLRGNPSRIFSAHEPRHAQWIDAEPLLADDPNSARQAHGWIARAADLNGGPVPRSLGAILLSRAGLEFDRMPLPGRGERYLLPPGNRQQILHHSARGEIRLYDLHGAFGAAVVAYGLPMGEGMAGLSWEHCDCHVRVIDCTVSDRSRSGLLPQFAKHGPHSAYEGGWYRTSLAEPLLVSGLATGLVQLREVHCVWSFPVCHDANALVHHAWNQRTKARAWYDQALWKSALHQALGKFGEGSTLSTYAFTPPNPAEGWRLVHWGAEVYSQDAEYHPPFYHPVAAAWIRQCAQIPLLPILCEAEKCLRVYVDSVVTCDLDLPVSENLGGWHKVAEGDEWRAKGAGICEIRGNGRRVWAAGSPKQWFSLEKAKIDTMLEKKWLTERG
jgi:hypothetical protein